MTTIVTQLSWVKKVVILSENTCPFSEFAKLCKQSFFSQLEISRVIYLTTQES